jgi:hypothetical protein
VIIVYSHAQPFTKEDFELFKVIALFVSKGIKARELQNLLNSRYAQWALIKHAKNEIGTPVTMAIQDPEGLARLLARTFFKEMTRAGFGQNHIINAASEIISMLHKNLTTCKERMR